MIKCYLKLKPVNWWTTYAFVFIQHGAKQILRKPKLKTAHKTCFHLYNCHITFSKLKILERKERKYIRAFLYQLSFFNKRWLCYVCLKKKTFECNGILSRNFLNLISNPNFLFCRACEPSKGSWTQHKNTGLRTKFGPQETVVKIVGRQLWGVISANILFQIPLRRTCIWFYYFLSREILYSRHKNWNSTNGMVLIKTEL